MSKLIGYRRVSTKGQGVSGLGLEGQSIVIAGFAKQADHQVVATYTEVESGTKTDRPELSKAMSHAKRIGATLVIARLDRLSRNLHFLSGLMESGVEFVACDMPSANRLTLHIMAAVAEDYAKQISDKTKMGLLAARARGTVLGGFRAGAAEKLTPEARDKGRAKGNALQARGAIEVYADLLGDMVRQRRDGALLGAIAKGLNESGHTTRTGTAWTATQVKRLLDRVGAQSPALPHHDPAPRVANSTAIRSTILPSR
jgi:DNA invertase Pin-like site-specific DNA recombinase